MGSAGQPDRSLGGGISLPQWMKNKMDVRFDFDDSTFSPPSHDDSFFYVRYSKAQETSKKNTEEGFRPISEVLNETKNITATKHVESSQPTPPDFKEVGNIDFSKHPLPCQPFVPNAAQKENFGTLIESEENMVFGEGLTLVMRNLHRVSLPVQRRYTKDRRIQNHSLAAKNKISRWTDLGSFGLQLFRRDASII